MNLIALNLALRSFLSALVFSNSTSTSFDQALYFLGKFVDLGVFFIEGKVKLAILSSSVFGFLVRGPKISNESAVARQGFIQCLLKVSNLEGLFSGFSSLNNFESFHIIVQLIVDLSEDGDFRLQRLDAELICVLLVNLESIFSIEMMLLEKI